MLAVGTEAGEVHIVDLKTRKPATEPLQVGKTISSLAFAPSGDELAIASAGADVQIWSRKAGSVRKLAHFDFQGRPRVQISTSGSLLVIADRVFLFASTTDLQRHSFGDASGTIADAGFLGSEFLYLVSALENRGISILIIATGKEVAYLRLAETVRLIASASQEGDALAIAGIDGVTTFACGSAIERLDLRRRMSSTDVTVNEGSKGERAGMLAAWYLAHGFFALAQRYVESSSGAERLCLAITQNGPFLARTTPLIDGQAVLSIKSSRVL